MKIHKLTLPDKEMVEAVQMFLKTVGVTMPVHSVEKEYRHVKETVVIFEFEVDKTPIREEETE